jgi:hypothetical protein
MGRPRKALPLTSPNWMPILPDAFEYRRKQIGSAKLATEDINAALKTGKLPAKQRMRSGGEALLSVSARADLYLEPWSMSLTYPTDDTDVRTAHLRSRRLNNRVVDRIVFVWRPDLHKLFSSGDAEPPKQDGDTAEQRRRGPKPKYDWETIVIEIARRFYNDGLPDNERDFTKEMLNWCVKNFHGAVPDSSLRGKVSRVRRAFEKK